MKQSYLAIYPAEEHWFMEFKNQRGGKRTIALQAKTLQEAIAEAAKFFEVKDLT